MNPSVNVIADKQTKPVEDQVVELAAIDVHAKKANFVTDSTTNKRVPDWLMDMFDDNYKYGALHVLNEDMIADAKSGIETTAKNASNFIKNPKDIHFTDDSSDFYTKWLNGLKPSEHVDPNQVQTYTTSKLFHTFPDKDKATIAIAPIYDLSILNKPDFAVHASLVLGSNSDERMETIHESYMMMVEHELGHALSINANHGNIDDELNKTFSHFSKDTAEQLDNEKVQERAGEIIGDSFAVLKTQQEYYLRHKEEILSEDKPLVAPVINSLFEYRKNNAKSHDSSDQLGLLIDKFSSVENNEKLANATDTQLIVTAYDVMAKTLHYEVNQSLHNYTTDKDNNLVSDSKKTVSVSFPENYLQSGEKPVYQFNFNPQFINDNTEAVQHHIDEDFSLR